MPQRPDVAENGPPKSGSLRLHGMVARDIGTSIVSGKLKPGDLLDREIEASDRLKVSRTAYREAVRILAAKGLVEVRPKVGTRITARDKWHLLDPDVLAWMFRDDPDELLLESLFELRKIIEPAAAALAAQRRTNHELDRMRDALCQMAEHTLAGDTGRAADQSFHAAILDASGNAYLQSLTSSVSSAVSWTTIFKQRLRPLVRDPLPDHVRVFEAIEACDPDAARQRMVELVDLALIDTTTARRRAPTRKDSLA